MLDAISSFPLIAKLKKSQLFSHLPAWRVIALAGMVFFNGCAAYRALSLTHKDVEMALHPPGDESAAAKANSLHAELVTKVLELGGTCTGEHGIGLRKLPYVRAEHGAAVETMWAIKDALDPLHILNPGKKLPPRMP